VHRGGARRSRASTSSAGAAGHGRRAICPHLILRAESTPAGKFSTSFTKEIHYYTDTELKNLLQGHSELYCSYPPQPDLPRAYHLLPSAVKEARLAAAQGSSESSERVDSQAGGEAEEGPHPAAATAAKKARLARPKAAVSPPNSWTRMRKEGPKANRTGTTPPTRAWSWPALYLRCQRASGKCANARPKKSSPPGTELLF
jgi:hypothetical protein